MLQLRPGSAKLLSLRAAPTEAQAPRADVLLQEKPPQREACAPQRREPQRAAAGDTYTHTFTHHTHHTLTHHIYMHHAHIPLPT